MFTNGADRSKGNIAKPLSTENRSELIKLISLPELVSVMLFMESLTTLSNKKLTNAFLIRKDT